MLKTIITLATACMLAACAAEKPQWQNYQDTDIANLAKQGKTVFVQYTADWCMTCLDQEKNVLHSQEIVEIFRKNNVVLVKADWTEYSENIDKDIIKHGQTGIPMYVLYSADKKTNGHVLPETITKKDIMEIF